MKNKTKLQKIKEASSIKRILPQGWIIMSRCKIGVAELKQIIAEDDIIEIWNEVGVLEITIGEKSSIDIEEFEVDPRDEYSLEFVTRERIVSLFYVTFRPEEFDKAEKYLKKIAAGIDGFICGDTEDFRPVIS